MTYELSVPAGATAGMKLKLTLPGMSNKVIITLPTGAEPGSTISFALPKGTVGGDEVKGVLPGKAVAAASPPPTSEPAAAAAPKAKTVSLYEQAHASELIAAWESEQQFTPEQESAMATFRARLEEEKLLTPWWDKKPHFYRFCQARQWNVDKAVSMFSAHLQFRKERGLDELVDSPELGLVSRFVLESRFPEKVGIKAAYPCVHHRVDRAGRLIWIERPGQMDISALHKAASKERLLEHFLWDFEATIHFRLPACSVAAGRYIGKATLIIDLAGFRLSTFYSARSDLKMISGLAQDNYPEAVQTMMIINAPKVFTVVWSFLKPLLDKRTREKINILGSNYLPTVLEHVRKEELPTFLGGSDDTCDLLNEKGPWVEQMPDNMRE